MLRRDLLGRGNSKYKGPEVGTCLHSGGAARGQFGKSRVRKGVISRR